MKTPAQSSAAGNGRRDSCSDMRRAYHAQEPLTLVHLQASSEPPHQRGANPFTLVVPMDTHGLMEDMTGARAHHTHRLPHIHLTLVHPQAGSEPPHRASADVGWQEALGVVEGDRPEGVNRGGQQAQQVAQRAVVAQAARVLPGQVVERLAGRQGAQATSSRQVGTEEEAVAVAERGREGGRQGGKGGKEEGGVERIFYTRQKNSSCFRTLRPQSTASRVRRRQREIGKRRGDEEWRRQGFRVKSLG